MFCKHCGSKKADTMYDENEVNENPEEEEEEINEDRRFEMYNEISGEIYLGLEKAYVSLKRKYPDISKKEFEIAADGAFENAWMHSDFLEGEE